MFIFWGEKRVEKKKGFVAEFCPYCRKLRPVKLIRIGQAPHLYLITLGTGKEIRHEARCLECRGCFEVDAGNYLTVSKRNPPDFQQLLMTTHPGILDACRERLELEAAILTNPHKLEPEIRAELLAEPFAELSIFADEIKHGPSHFDWFSAVFAIGSLLAIIGAFMAAPFDVLGTGWLSGFLVGISILSLIATLYFLYTSNRRRIRKFSVPLLRRALFPLQPSLEEIRETMISFSDLAIGKYIKPEKLIDRSQSLLRISR